MSKIRDIFNIMMIKRSGFFNKKYYKLENPDVRGNLVKHYYFYGFKEGRNPSEKFNNDYYLDTYRDVKYANVNPLVHYLRSGKKEERKIKRVDGLKIDKIYRKLYKKQYFNNVLLKDLDKRANIFVYEINKDNIDTIKKLNGNRLIYKNIEGVDIKNLNLDGLEIEHFSTDYYLNIGCNDINICLDENSLIIVKNSYYFNNIYFYFDVNKQYSDEFVNYLSYYCTLKKINIMCNENVKIKKTIINNVKLDDYDNTVFIFNENLVLDLEIINDYFLNNCTNKQYYYNSKEISCKISLENDMKLEHKCNYIDFNELIFDNDGVYFDTNHKMIDFQCDEYLEVYIID